MTLSPESDSIQKIVVANLAIYSGILKFWLFSNLFSYTIFHFVVKFNAYNIWKFLHVKFKMIRFIFKLNVLALQLLVLNFLFLLISHIVITDPANINTTWNPGK